MVSLTTRHGVLWYTTWCHLSTRHGVTLTIHVNYPSNYPSNYQYCDVEKHTTWCHLRTKAADAMKTTPTHTARLTKDYDLLSQVIRKPRTVVRVASGCGCVCDKNDRRRPVTGNVSEPTTSCEHRFPHKPSRSGTNRPMSPQPLLPASISQNTVRIACREMNLNVVNNIKSLQDAFKRVFGTCPRADIVIVVKTQWRAGSAPAKWVLVSNDRSENAPCG